MDIQIKNYTEFYTNNNRHYDIIWIIQDIAGPMNIWPSHDLTTRCQRKPKRGDFIENLTA
ncbi:hypothetical protein NQ317_016279 [Molorchus minor]|uniref:Uncharacterized protein n=1 Tax=Molorchus minor TaxID=1323400 RepID=A0ABQ9JZF6_9CUCU|nr:hypothetical protein NQ317_016279 [Molorchus minor]